MVNSSLVSMETEPSDQISLQMNCFRWAIFLTGSVPSKFMNMSTEKISYQLLSVNFAQSHGNVCRGEKISFSFTFENSSCYFF